MLRTRSRKLALKVRIFVIVSITFTYLVLNSVSKSKENVSLSAFHTDSYVSSGRHLLSIPKDRNCTPPAINEFPSDGLTREQRQNGWVLVHVVVACYLFTLLAIVCDDFFVPAIKQFCNSLHLSEDVAGATFMAIASSSPELFINSVGTFITEGDLGVGTIVGSAVFNILAVPACCGLFANMVLELDWWPLTRDSLMYGTALIMLISTLYDGKVESYEAALLVSAYIAYICVIYFNKSINNFVNRLVRMCRRKRSYIEKLSETQPLLTNGKGVENGPIIVDTEITLKDCEEFDDSTSIWEWPSKTTTGAKIWWIATWPICFVLFITTPDCKKYPRLYVVTFIMCIVWIGGTSYTVAWLITVIGDTINIPDSVMGLTFLAAGTSVPEAVSSIIVTNQGHGAMGLSSSIGSNTFDILLCLGIPWLIKTWFYPKIPDQHIIIINSSGLTYSAVSLFSTLIMFYLSIYLNRFRLDWKIGLTCLMIYIVFLAFASLIELNVFFPVNLPTCDR